MKKNTKYNLYYLPPVMLLGISAIALRVYAALTELNYQTGYYESKVISTTSGVLTVVAVLIAFSFLFFGKAHTPAPRPVKASSYIPAGAIVATVLFLSTELFVGLTEVSAASTPGLRLSIPLLLDVLTALLGLASIIGFFLSIFYEKRENTRKAAYSMATVLFFAAYAAHLYFDTSMPINSPAKICDQMAFLLSSVFFLYETRISLGRSIWRAHTAFGIIASIVCLYSSIPTIIVFFVKGRTISDSLAASILLLLVAVYSIQRVVSFLVSEPDEKCATVTALEKLVAKRETELSEGLPHQGYKGKVVINEGVGENYEMQIPQTQSDDTPTDADAESV